MNWLRRSTIPPSPLYQHWITPDEYGRRFGVSDSDLHQITAWLIAQGFQVDEVPEGRRSIVFSGTAAQVTSAFRTEIHEYFTGGEIHRANEEDPEIPEALAGVVAGIASLHDFQSSPALVSVTPAVSPAFTNGNGHFLAPADFATIYDATPLYAGGIDGTGTSIAVVARSNLRLADTQAFRTIMGLTANSPTVIVNGPNPGVLARGEQAEATLDAEWAVAVAREGFGEVRRLSVNGRLRRGGAFGAVYRESQPRARDDHQFLRMRSRGWSGLRTILEQSLAAGGGSRNHVAGCLGRQRGCRLPLLRQRHRRMVWV
jgi:subtilase family serine protease